MSSGCDSWRRTSFSLLINALVLSNCRVERNCSCSRIGRRIKKIGRERRIEGKRGGKICFTNERLRWEERKWRHTYESLDWVNGVVPTCVCELSLLNLTLPSTSSTALNCIIGETVTQALSLRLRSFLPSTHDHLPSKAVVALPLIENSRASYVSPVTWPFWSLYANLIQCIHHSISSWNPKRWRVAKGHQMTS